MAHLIPSSEMAGRNPSRKFMLPCQKWVDKGKDTSEWLEIRAALSDRHPVLSGIMEKRKAVVVKYGPPKDIHHEYDISKDIQTLPNMIRFYCSFVCKEGVLAGRDFNKHPYLCATTGDDVGFIAMPHIPLGSMNHVRWTRGNLEALKSVTQQVCCAILYAFERVGFLHNDLHLSNVLLKKTAKSSERYGAYSVNVDTYYAVLMDFGRSGTVAHPSLSVKIPVPQPLHVYTEISHILNRLNLLDHSDLQFTFDIEPIRSYISNNTPIDGSVYETVCRIIDSITVLYSKSEVLKRTMQEKE